MAFDYPSIAVVLAVVYGDPIVDSQMYHLAHGKYHVRHGKGDLGARQTAMSVGFQQPRPITLRGNSVFHKGGRECASGGHRLDMPKQEDGEESVRSDLCKYKHRWLEGFQLRTTSR